MSSKNVPALASFVRLETDRITGEPILLGPEVAVKLTQSADDILRLCDGRRTVDEIGDALAKQYEAPADEIIRDAADLLFRLAEKGYVKWVAP